MNSNRIEPGNCSATNSISAQIWIPSCFLYLLWKMADVEEVNNDICPICKTDRYLNSNMKFLINPECYHKMCDSCVDRIFSFGPNQCPYKGCGKILRKSKFKTQIFEDIAVEKEIDVRKRICKIFNKTQNNFETLDEYNKYLEKVEEIIYNLIHDVDVEKTNEYVNKYKQENQKVIQQNNINIQKQQEKFQKQETQKKMINEQKKNLSLQLIKELRNDEKLAKQEIENSLLNSAMSTSDIVDNVKRNLLKQASSRKRRYFQENSLLQKQLQSQDDADLYLENGAKRKLQKTAPVLSPFTPFNGDRNSTDKFVVEPEYYDPHISKLATEPTYLAGGFRVEQFYRFSLFESVLGLGCFISEEKV